MATVMKYNNISIQPLKVTCPSTTNTVSTSKDNLTWEEINRKSTSDRRKRRVAHVPKYPVPIIKEPIPSTEKEENQKQKKLQIKMAENDKFKKVQNLGNQHIKIKNLRNFITTIPWSYGDVFGRSISEKRSSNSLESTTLTIKKQKIN